MKLAIVNSAFYPREVGGVETYLSATVPELSRRVKLVVITGSLLGKHEGSPAELSAFAAADVREVGMGRRYPIWDWRRHGPAARAIWQILDIRDRVVERNMATILEEEAPDVVHTHNIRGLSLSALNLPEKLGIPHVHTLHDFLLLSPSTNLQFGGLTLLPGSLPNRMYQRLTRDLTHGMADVIAPSRYILGEHLRRRFFQRSRRHILRMPSLAASPVDGRVQPPEVKAESANQRPQFLFVGNLEASKGVRILLRAIERISGADADFHIVGTGSLAKLVLACAAKDPRIKYHGRVQTTLLRSLYRKCDALIFASVWPENAPMVLSEATAFGLPAIASDVGGVRELVSEDTGWLVEPGSPASLASLLQFLIANPDSITEKAERTRRDSSLPSLEDHLMTLMGIYSECTASGPL